MLFESRQARQVEKEDFKEKELEKLTELKPFLEELSKELQEKGFFLDKDCRIKEEEFKDIFPKKEIEKDKKIVENLEKKFSKNKEGELLEVIKTIVFNKFWFSNNLISLRTSKFDDYCNGVDEIILDLKTKQPLAAVDETTDPLGKIEKVKEKIIQGSSVKYGFSLSESKINKRSLENLPTFIVSLKPEELINLTQALLNKDNLESFEKKVVNFLLEQSQQFQKIACPKMKDSYKNTEEIFKRISL